MKTTSWTENIILADADYIDKVAFDLTVNFERMIGRRIPKADMARWAECIALDGGLREGEHETHVILVYDHRKLQMENFVPGNYKQELNGQAFRSRLGEFSFNAVTTQGLVGKDELFMDTLRFIVGQGDTKRIMVVPDEALYNNVCEALRHADPEKHITVFAMQPSIGGSFQQEILGYSLMSALGIKASEIPTEQI